MSKIIKFENKGLKTVEGAKARIAKIEALVTTSRFFVAEQDGKFFPVCVISQEDSHHVFGIANSGIYVIRT